MGIRIVNWANEISEAKLDQSVGIQIATLLETEQRGTYIAVIPAGEAIKPHYHQEGDEEYHIISGKGIIRLIPATTDDKDFKLACKHVTAQNSFIIPPNVIHQLVNTGDQPLTLIFSCPFSHLKEDRHVVENLEEKLNE